MRDSVLVKVLVSFWLFISVRHTITFGIKKMIGQEGLVAPKQPEGIAILVTLLIIVSVWKRYSPGIITAATFLGIHCILWSALYIYKVKHGLFAEVQHYFTNPIMIAIDIVVALHLVTIIRNQQELSPNKSL